jgi:hypothetical protein
MSARASPAERVPANARDSPRKIAMYDPERFRVGQPSNLGDLFEAAQVECVNVCAVQPGDCLRPQRGMVSQGDGLNPALDAGVQGCPGRAVDAELVIGADLEGEGHGAALVADAEPPALLRRSLGRVCVEKTGPPS